MKKLPRLLIAGVLTFAAIVSVSSNAAASTDWCVQCAQSGGCYACCRCENLTATHCGTACYS